jgi:hypothetical protein
MVAQSASPSHTRPWTAGGSLSTLRMAAIEFLISSVTASGASSSMVEVLVAVVATSATFLIALLRVRDFAVSGLNATRFAHVQLSRLNLAMAESEIIVMATASRALPGVFLLVLLVGRLALFMRTMLDHWAVVFFIVTMKF